MANINDVIKGLECVIYPNRFCGDCSYFIRNENDPDTGWCNRDAIYKDALALLKEKEPKIISLKELTCLSRNTPIYMELRNNIQGWEIYDGFDRQTREMITGALWGPHEFWDSSEYGRTWRCWSFPPTSEQRKKEVW